MQILLTGGCGFIGSHVADRLVADGHIVTVVDDLSSGTREKLNNTATLVVGNVTDAGMMQTLIAKADAVIHLAAIASVQVCNEQWLHAHRTNLTGTVTILDAARARNIPVVYASSAAVYGDNPNLPLSETAATAPLSAYGLDKLSCEHNAAIAWKYHGVPSVGLRFFNVYGPRQDATSPYSGVISKFAANARAGKPLTIFGDGEQTRDFIYVGDIVELIMAALKHTNGATIYNGCTGTATSLKQLAAAIGDTLGHRLTVTHETARDGDIRHSLGDAKQAAIDLKFTATTSLAAGLKQLLAHA